MMTLLESNAVITTIIFRRFNSFSQMARTRFLFLTFQILPLIVDAASLGVHPAERRIRMINADPAMDTIDNPPAFRFTAQLFSSPVTCLLI